MAKNRRLTPLRREMRRELSARDHKGPQDADPFVNAKAEAHWSLREWLERRELAGLTEGRRKPNSPASVTGTPLKAGWRSRAKEDAKKRGQSSPGRAEATVMAFARVVPRQQTVAWNGPSTISTV